MKQQLKTSNPFSALLGVMLTLTLIVTLPSEQPLQAQQSSNNAANTATITGVVATLPTSAGFEVRSTRGASYTIVAGDNLLPPSLAVGDWVRIYGTLDDGKLRAANMRLLEHGGPAEVQRAANTLVGTVVRDEPGALFTIRTTSGVEFQVQAPESAPGTYSVGDLVSSFGEWRGDSLHASSVRVLKEGAPPNNVRLNPTMTIARGISDIPKGTGIPEANGFVTRTGRVENLNGNLFMLHASNGKTYSVRAAANYRLPTTLSDGDLASVYGTMNNGTLQANNVRIAYQAEAAEVDLNPN